MDNFNQGKYQKYCCYIPYQMNVNETDAEFVNYISTDCDLSKLKKVTLVENKISLLKNDDKVFVIAIPKSYYKPARIVPAIEDITNKQIFIALSIRWIELEDFQSEETSDTLLTLVNNNKDKIKRYVDSYLKKLCNIFFYSYKIA
jgi:hypothetical protein